SLRSAPSRGILPDHNPTVMRTNKSAVHRNIPTVLAHGQCSSDGADQASAAHRVDRCGSAGGINIVHLALPWRWTERVGMRVTTSSSLSVTAFILWRLGKILSHDQ